MQKAGLIELTFEVIEKAFKEKKKLKVVATMSSDWLSTGIDNIYKPYINDGIAYLMKPQARKKGIPLQRFENAFCRVV